MEGVREGRRPTNNTMNGDHLLHQEAPLNQSFPSILLWECGVPAWPSLLVCSIALDSFVSSRFPVISCHKRLPWFMS